MEERTWPECFPQGCPPNESIKQKSEFFRLTCEKPSSVDFLMYRDDNPRINGKYSEADKNPLKYYQCFGLSMYMNIVSLRNVCKASGAMKKVASAKGFISRGDSRDGVYLHTPTESSNSHYTIWLYKDARPWEYFIVCERVS